MSRADAIAKAAEDCHEWLRTTGEKKRANDIRSALHSWAITRNQLKLLNRENRIMRAQLAALGVKAEDVAELTDELRGQL